MVMGTPRQEAEVVVIGSGPGGYVAALRAAQLGREVVIVEERDRPGGVCLLEGCIPSKTLVHVVEAMEQAHRLSEFGVVYQAPSVDLMRLRQRVDEVVSGLTSGVQRLLEMRGVTILHGRARITAKHSVFVEGPESLVLDFRHLILATGSRPRPLAPGEPEGVWSAADALALPEVPDSLVVVGGGFVGLELGLVYSGLGSRVSVVEFFPRLLPGADEDLVQAMVRSIRSRFHEILVDSEVEAIEERQPGFRLIVGHGGERRILEADRVLTAIGRVPNTQDLGLEKVGIRLDERGRIPVDETCRTSAPGIYAIGDITPGPMLAHKASREGKVAAEHISGHPSAFDNRAIPAAVFTDPEIAWTGLTEREAVQARVAYEVARFPLKALGRARAMGRTEGVAKIIFEPGSGRILGVGLVGPQASELVAEATLAVEMGAVLEDLVGTIHPHPTLSEAILEAAEVGIGAPTHVDAKSQKGTQP